MTDSFFDAAPRRSLVGRLAGALVGLLPAAAMAAEPEKDGPNWPGALRAPHKLLVDGYAINHGMMLSFAHTFLATNPKDAANVVVVLRSAATPIGLDHSIWAKYRIGETMKIIDPETNAPAVKNPFLKPKPGVLQNDEVAVDRLHEAGAIFGVCSVALHGQSKSMAHNAGVSPEEAAKEWAANLIPGATLMPSGVWGLGRAQEAGCGYCSGGG